MGLSTKIKNFTQVQTIKMLASLLPKFSNKNLVKISYLAERLADTDWTKNQIREIRNYFENGHPAVEFARRISKDLCPNCRDKFVRNFIINSGITGINRHMAYAKKHGYEPPPGLFSSALRCAAIFAV
jgi:hypothetical protein